MRGTTQDGTGLPARSGLPGAAGPPRNAGWPERLALVASAGLVLLGGWWWADPSAYPFGPQDRFSDMSLVSVVSASVAAPCMVVAGVVTACLAFALVSRIAIRRWAIAVMTAIASVVAVTFGYVVPDIQLLILLAYAATLSLPAAVAFLAVWTIARAAGLEASPALWRAATSAGVVLSLTIVGLVLVGRPWEWGDRGPDASLTRPLVTLTLLLVGVAWALVALRLARRLRGACLRCGRPGRAWTRPAAAARWGRIVTIAAALAPLPYVLTRLTWLTPWPYGESHDVLAANPALWLFGLGLAAAGELGTWLTLGLITTRGEVFPPWVPVLGGRPVPVMAAVVPGGVVALLMCVAGHSILQQALAPGASAADRLLVVLVPLPLWGALLGAATLAYWYRRRPPCRLGCAPSSP